MHEFLHLRLNAAKNTHRIKKKASNKSYSYLNFLQKSPRAHMSIFHRSGDRGLKRCASLKNYNVEKRKSRFTLGLEAATNKHSHQKKGSNKCCSELNFV